MCYCTQEEKINFEGFTQNGCYGNQLQPFEAGRGRGRGRGAFYRFYLEITLFYTTLSGQIISCDVTDVKILRSFSLYIITTLPVFDLPKFQELYLNTLQSRKVGAN